MGTYIKYTWFALSWWIITSLDQIKHVDNNKQVDKGGLDGC